MRHVHAHDVCHAPTLSARVHFMLKQRAQVLLYLTSLYGAMSASSTGFNFDNDDPAFILQATRIKVAAEFLDAMKKSTPVSCFGVLLSGPNGVGKSSCGVLAALACIAQGLPVVYIPDARQWTAATINGDGDKYFLERFLTLNAGTCRR